MINEQLWVGHFDLWPNDGMVMFRHALVLAGGVKRRPASNARRCWVPRSIPASAIIPAFQFVVWAGKTAARGARRRDVRDLGRGRDRLSLELTCRPARGGMAP